MKQTLASVIIFMLMLLLMIAAPVHAGPVIKCLSTTSTENSGLMNYLLPLFEKSTGIKVMLIARGTGAALEAGRRGDADVVLVHAKADELKLLREGWFVNRHDIMYNEFIILGPASDPANIKEAASAPDAFRRIALSGSSFVSRGDRSGTHKKELSIWEAAGIRPLGQWYMEAGQGMAKSMRIASEKGAYVLADRGTWLSRLDQMNLVILFDGDSMLFNQYGVMAVNPERHAHVKYEAAMAFVHWLISEQGQRAIGGFRVNGKALFVPNAGGSTDWCEPVDCGK